MAGKSGGKKPYCGWTQRQAVPQGFTKPVPLVIAAMPNGPCTLSGVALVCLTKGLYATQTGTEWEVLGHHKKRAFATSVNAAARSNYVRAIRGGFAGISNKPCQTNVKTKEALHRPLSFQGGLSWVPFKFERAFRIGATSTFIWASSST